MPHASSSLNPPAVVPRRPALEHRVPEPTHTRIIGSPVQLPTRPKEQVPPMLLKQPGEAVADLGRFMKALSARTTRYFNRLESRSGTLWESRYKSSPVQTEQYLLACCRYIELNPVRARMAAQPGEYHWSSYTARMGGTGQEWLDLDPGQMK